MSENTKSKGLFAEKILAKRDDGKEIKYLVKWNGLSIDKATWKEERYLENVRGLIEEFEKNSIYATNKQENQELCNTDDEKTSVKKEKKQAKIKSKHSESSVKMKETQGSSGKKPKKINENGISKEEAQEKSKKEELNQTIVYSPDLTLDVPDKVISAKIFEQSLCCLVTWKLRPNGIVPEPSYVLSEFLRDKFPYPLIEFYESKIQFYKKKVDN